MDLDSIRDNLGIGGSIVLIGSVLTVVGAFLPWATFDTFAGSASVSGMDGDGVLTLIGGLVAGAGAGVAGARSWNIVAVRLAAVAGLAITAIAIYYLNEPVPGTPGFGSADRGIGLFITCLGGLLVLGGTALGSRNLVS